jgi:hypothetical protein
METPSPPALEVPQDELARRELHAVCARQGAAHADVVIVVRVVRGLDAALERALHASSEVMGGACTLRVLACDRAILDALVKLAQVLRTAAVSDEGLVALGCAAIRTALKMLCLEDHEGLLARAPGIRQWAFGVVSACMIMLRKANLGFAARCAVLSPDGRDAAAGVFSPACSAERVVQVAVRAVAAGVQREDGGVAAGVVAAAAGGVPASGPWCHGAALPLLGVLSSQWDCGFEALLALDTTRAVRRVIAACGGLQIVVSALRLPTVFNSPGLLHGGLAVVLAMLADASASPLGLGAALDAATALALSDAVLLGMVTHARFAVHKTGVDIMHVVAGSATQLSCNEAAAVACAFFKHVVQLSASAFEKSPGAVASVLTLMRLVTDIVILVFCSAAGRGMRVLEQRALLAVVLKTVHAAASAAAPATRPFWGADAVEACADTERRLRALAEPAPPS